MESKKSNKKRNIILLLLLLLVVSFGGLYVLKGSPTLSFDSLAKKYDAKVKKPVNWSEDKIAFPAFEKVNTIEGEGKMYVALANPSFNNAYIKFELFMDDSTEAFFSSELVKPGEAITEVTLPEALSAGEHTVQLNMKGFASDNSDTELNGTNTQFKLMVLKNS